MPGINIIKSPYVNSKGLKACEEFKSNFNEVLPHINCQILYHNDDTILYETNYEYYDQKYQELEDWQISWEGIDHIDFVSIVKTLNIFTQQEISGESLRRWRDSTFCNCTSGFFFLAHHPKTGTVVFANDDLARFPVYIYHNNCEFFIGREYSLLRFFTKEIKPDKLLISLYLLFRYAPGHGSPFQEINTLECSSIGIYTPKFDNLIILSDLKKRMPLEYYNGDKKTILNDLGNIFIDATDKCLNGRPGLLALSGGYDSRAVAAALFLTKKSFSAVTRSNADGTTNKELKIAKRLSEEIGFSHKIVKLKPENEQHFKILFSIKRGLNYFAEVDMINFLIELIKEYGNYNTFLTGGGGEKIMKPLAPFNIKFNSNNIITYILSKHCWLFNNQISATIFNIDLDAIKEYLYNLLNIYPVDNWNDKYRYFVLNEIGNRWYKESEDRNRYYYPSNTPFYNRDFYKLALSIPDTWKKNNIFYWEFLSNLCPEFCNVPIAAEFISHKSSIYQFSQSIINILRNYKYFQNIGVKVLKINPNEFSTKNFLIERIIKFTDNDLIKDIEPDINYLNKLNKMQLYNLYNTLSIITNNY